MTTNNQAPANLPPVTGIVPYIQLADVRAAAELYKNAFGAEVIGLVPMGERNAIIHGYVRINGGALYMSDPFPEEGHPLQKPQGYTLHLQVDNAQKWYDRAVTAGLTPVMPVARQFWGDDYGQLRDTFGVLWSIGSTPR